MKNRLEVETKGGLIIYLKHYGVVSKKLNFKLYLVIKYLKNIKYILLFLVFQSMTTVLSVAQGCPHDGNFYKVAPNKTLIIRCTVIEFFKGDSAIQKPVRDIYQMMTVQVLQVYKGVEKRDTINVWGSDGGDMCRPYLKEDFKKGQEYVLALDIMDKKGNYAQGLQGQLYLWVRNGKVSRKRSRILKDKFIRKVTLKGFERKLLKLLM